jgi:hypothetical protein
LIVKSVFFWEDAQGGAGPYAPADRHDFDAKGIAFISDEGSEGTDVFDFRVCTPNRLASEGPEFGRGVIVMREWDRNALESAIAQKCTEIGEDEDWSRLALELSEWIEWEFAYRYEPRPRD